MRMGDRSGGRTVAWQAVARRVLKHEWAVVGRDVIEWMARVMEDRTDAYARALAHSHTRSALRWQLKLVIKQPQCAKGR